MSKDQNATPQFAQYLAEEIEIACGCGTDSRLVVCAERKVLKELRKRLSRQVQQVIVGTVEQNLCQASPGVVTDRLSDLCLA